MPLSASNNSLIGYGIVGLGYGQTIASDAQENETYPTILTQMKNQGYINSLAFSLWLNDLGK